jgi:hypothetical protein
MSCKLFNLETRFKRKIDKIYMFMCGWWERGRRGCKKDLILECTYN